MNDLKMAELARILARHLIAFARDRRDEDRKAIASLHTELCKAFREEEKEDEINQT